MNITLYMLYNCYIMLYMLYNRYITYITVICPSLLIIQHYKHDEVVEEIPHFSSHYSEHKPDEKGNYDSISAVPIIALGGNSNTLVNDQKIIPLIFFVILAFIVILIIWYIYRQFFHPTKKEEIFYP